MWTSWRSAAAWLLLTLAAPAFADDPHKPAPGEDPDPGFLEFLGGVDGLADTNPDYLAQANNPRAAPSTAKLPPSPPPQPPPTAPGGRSND